MANRIICYFTIVHWNEHKNQTRNVTNIINNNAVDDLKKRENAVENLTESEKKQLNFGKKEQHLAVDIFILKEK